MIAGPPRRCGTLKSKPTQVELVDEDIDHAHRAVFPDIVVDTVRKQQSLPSITPFDETWHLRPPNPQKETSRSGEFSHSLGGKRSLQTSAFPSKGQCSIRFAERQV